MGTCHWLLVQGSVTPGRLVNEAQQLLTRRADSVCGNAREVVAVACHWLLVHSAKPGELVNKAQQQLIGHGIVGCEVFCGSNLKMLRRWCLWHAIGLRECVVAPRTLVLTWTTWTCSFATTKCACLILVPSHVISTYRTLAIFST